MLLCTLLAFISAGVYNFLLTVHLYKEKISTTLHEDYLKKKEIEYAVGISEMWNTRYLYAFSSFKGEVLKMYHRPMFNFFCICLALVHALMLESTAKLGIITGMFAILALYTILLRPYRSVHSNIVLFVLSSVLLVTCFLLLLKKTGLNSAIFVEDYFYGMLIIVNGFGWFILLAFILLILQTRR